MTADYIAWSGLFEIGVPRIDEEHRELARMVNEFHEAIEKKSARAVIFPILNGLVRYVEEHFRNEERLMQDCRFPELLRHKREHEKLTLEIFNFAELYEREEAEVTGELMEFLKSWLLNHILQEDKKIEAHLKTAPRPPGW